MVLLVEGKQISAEVVSNPEQVYMLIKSNMALVMASNQLKSKAVEKFTGKSDGLLYLHQREMAIVGSQDECVRTIGSDGATSCLLVVVRRISTGDVSMCRYDGCGAPVFVKTSIEKMLQMVPQSVSPAKFDVHMVGGFQDIWLDITRMTGEVLLALQASPFEFHLRTACVALMNNRLTDGAAYPIIHGVAFCVRTGQLRPAEFEDRGPWAALRGARFLGSRQSVATVYQTGSQRLVIDPFSYRQPSPGGLSLDFLINLADDKLVKCFSACPGQERAAAYARQMRETLRFMREHRLPLVDVDVFGRGSIVESLRPGGGRCGGGDSASSETVEEIEAGGENLAGEVKE